MSRFRFPRRDPDDVPINGRSVAEAEALEKARRRAEQEAWRERARPGGGKRAGQDEGVRRPDTLSPIHPDGLLAVAEALEAG